MMAEAADDCLQIVISFRVLESPGAATRVSLRAGLPVGVRTGG
jgi:hypothetical protein